MLFISAVFVPGAPIIEAFVFIREHIKFTPKRGDSTNHNDNVERGILLSRLVGKVETSIGSDKNITDHTILV